MSKIIRKEPLATNTKLFELEAQLIAKKSLPGQFVILRLNEQGERIPLTIADYEREKGTITIVVQEVGKSTYQLGKMEVGDRILDVIGPLGTPSEIENFGTVVCVGGGVGIAPIYPITRALKEKGNKIISIIGARSKDLLFWEDKMREVSNELIVTTDDGSYGKKGVVTEPLKEILEREKIDRAIAIGPPIMMKFVAKTTLSFGVKTIVSLNPIMVDGTGMCGACRCSIGGKTKFACVDGPEFDAHQVDFDLLMNRLRVYLDEEKKALGRFQSG
ncbi:MAG: sulfide/dihydroorotate dehydrogenase-like FAD/NAD-binding protein [Candidatus Thermoplasmatota archaeon]